MARAHQELRNLEAARDSYTEALAIRRELAEHRPDVYRPDVAMTLNNLGVAQRALNELEAARDSYTEALAIRRELAEHRPDVYRPDVAMTLNNLGNVQRDLNELEAAGQLHRGVGDLPRAGRTPAGRLPPRRGHDAQQPGQRPA